MSTFPARFSGSCDHCGGPIRIGDLIEWDDDLDGYRHGGCIEQVPTGSVEWVRRNVCPDCWLVHPPGVCDR